MAARNVDSLALIPLFSDFAPDDLKSLAERSERMTYLSGDEIIREGDDDKRLFVIVRGVVEVIAARGTHNERSLSLLGPGEHFGEMALIDDLVRSATVVARDETDVLVLDRVDLLNEIGKTPGMAFEMLRTLSRRIRALEKLLMNALGGLLPICVNCKNIRTEEGDWVAIEQYISDRSETDFTHGICPECMRKLYPHHFKDKQ